MTKQPVKPVHSTDFTDRDPSDQTIKPAHKARNLLTVKYTGPGQAVLGARFILHNETRANVSRSDLEKAEIEHAGEFEIVEQADALEADETAAATLNTTDFQAGVVPNPQALPWSMEPGGTSTIPASPAVDPMLPVKTEKASEKAPEKAAKK